MIRYGNSSGLLRVLRSYKSYLFMVLFLYLLVILVFHAQLHVYDGTAITSRSKLESVEYSPINTNRSSHLQPFPGHKTRNSSSNLRFPGPNVFAGEDQPSVKDGQPYDREFPLITDCFPKTFSTNTRKNGGLTFQSIGEHYLYSAYFDDRRYNEPPTIRIIALLKKSDKPQFYCHIPVASEEDPMMGADGPADGHDSTKDQHTINKASAVDQVSVGYGSHGTGGNSDIEDGVKRSRGNHGDEHYLKLSKYSKPVTDDDDNKHTAESHKDDQNAPNRTHRSNIRIDRKSTNNDPLTGDDPENRSGHQRIRYKNGDVPMNHGRPIEGHPRLRYHTVRASVYEMCENHNKAFGGWILSCPIDLHIRQPPCEVLISLSRQGTPAKNASASAIVSIPVFRVGHRDSSNRKKEDFGICVPPLFGHIPSTTLVEFVEFSRILGASHFLFYHHQVSREIAKALSYYANRGTVTTIRWDLPVDDKSVWYHGQLLAINDCLYRSMHAFRHVAFNDIDEFVVPHVHLTWKDMVASFRSSTLGHERTSLGTAVLLEKRGSDGPLRGSLGPLEIMHNENSGPVDGRNGQVPQASKGAHEYGSLQSLGKLSGHIVRSTLAPTFPEDGGKDFAGYSFQSAFFDPLLSGLISHVMYDLESDLRTKAFSKVRSKVMVRPEAIFELGIHHVSRLVSEDLAVYQVPTDVAFVHHYRKCVSEFDPLMSCQIFAHDESLSRFIPTIRHNIHQTLWCMKEASLTDEDNADKLHSHTAAASIHG